ncbi:palmdelphin isoform X3 [Pipistrellus kuhlii]|uniref:palmdelphin isoform X3 n=1 Tax=Pipistrellus kuhlii TaxID=59472 RepID=UPI001E2703A2|nr:palmdelphin isoform X3 [Pipistrellus kuhlii]
MVPGTSCRQAGTAGMDEAGLLRARLQAITDKRKIQEEISEKRLKIEEEKLQHQHLKKKALRESWLLDGVGGGGKEQEELKRQNQQDQRQIQALDQSILRLEKEIQDLERAELRVSAHEEAILKKLKSVERTTEDIIRSVKVEKEGAPGESIEDIYANIPDLPKSYVPSRLRKERGDGLEEDEHSRKALYAMELKVEKDLKTGESTVLSSIPLPSEDFTGEGVKVYDDGRKSVHEVGSGPRAALNGADGLAPLEVEELLRQASERRSRSPTEYHEPVFANAFRGPGVREPAPRQANGLGGHRDRAGPHADHGLSPGERADGLHPDSPPRPTPRPRRWVIPHAERQPAAWEGADGTPDGTPDKQASPVRRPEGQGPPPPGRGAEEDVRYNIVHSLPPDLDGAEPVTMIFMGYQQADDHAEERGGLAGYDGVIHAELVVIDEEEGEGEARKPAPHARAPHGPAHQPARPTPLPRKKAEARPPEDARHPSPHKNSMSLREQESRLGSPARPPLPLAAPAAGDGTEDPSLTALRIRMAKLGKKVI